MPSLPVPVFVMLSLPMDHCQTRVPALYVRVDVWYKHILQAQIKALLFGAVRKKEECPKAEGDEGTEDEEEDEFL